jgi:hypothetical protein
LVIVPTCGLIVQVTAVFEVPLTVGVNVALWPPVRDALPGDKLRLTVAGGGGVTGLATGCRIKEADALLPGFAALVAITVTVSSDVMLAGAV